MNNKIQDRFEKLGEKLDIPREAILDVPKITIISNTEVTIENHKGIMLFEREEIKIRTSIGTLSILGQDFEIIFIGGTTMVLNGKFKAVGYLGDE